MTELFSQLLAWVSANPFWSWVAVFLVAFAESVAVVGLLVPGVVLMFGFGALIATGALEFWPVFWWAVAGAVTGDGMSFWLGRHFQDRLRGLWPFSRHPGVLERGIDFFQKYGGKSVAIGRFFGPVRAVIPLVAGMLGMPPWRFVIANLLSALAWAPAYLLPGVVLGASLELASEVALRLVLLLLLLLATLWLVFHLVRWCYRAMRPYTSRIVQWLFGFGGRHRGLREIALALANPDHPEFKGLSQLASLLLVSVLLFALVAGAIPSHATADLNGGIHNGLQSLRSPWADALMVHLSRFGDLSVILVFSAGVLGFLLWQGNRRAAGYWLAAVGFGILAPELLKHGLRIPRPEPAIASLDPWSFPSSHVLRALSVYGFFAVMLARSIERDWRWLNYGLVAILTTAIALARIYLGAEWLTDVLGSLLLGLAWISGLGIAYHHHTRAETHPYQLGILALSVLALDLGTHAWLYQRDEILRYQPRPAMIQLSAANWRQGSVEDLPAYRRDIRNQRDQPLDIQYAGDPERLAHTLQQHGWKPAEMLQGANLLRLLSPSLPLQRLPVLPQVHDGRHERLVLEQPQPDGGRLVLRLWASPIRLEPGDRPLWLGSVSSQRKTVVLYLLSYPVTEQDFDAALAQLRRDLEGSEIHVKTERRGRLLLSDR